MESARQFRASTTEAREGRIVGGYRLERPLGRGGMAEVWLGRHETSHGLAAIKILKPSARDAAKMLFENERRAVLRLRHPNIVPVFDVGEDYIATAYIEGVDLRHRMRSPMAPREAIDIACAVGSALAQAHADGVVHCDVKPANVLIDHTGTPFLADFGIARILEDDRGEGEADDVRAGTPAFMAPEQAGGEILPASDQYALARTLLAMLTGGRLPLHPDEALALLPDDLAPSLGPVLRRAMAIVPEARFESMPHFIDALRAVDVKDEATAARLVALKRDAAPYRWAEKPHRVEKISESIARADYLLSEIVEAGRLDADAARAFLDEAGFVDFGWSVYARHERLGQLTSREVFARASESVVFLHGLFTSREVWRDVAIGVARDNGLAVVLTPDLMGFGASPLHPRAPSSAGSPIGVVRSVKAWLALIGLGGTPTVALGHSLSATALLCARDAELGVGVHRVCVTPALFYHRWTLRAYTRANALFGYLVALLPRAVWRAVARFAFRRDPSLARIRVGARFEMADAAIRLGPRRTADLFWNLASARPAPPEELTRCTIVTTPDDPLVPVDLAEESIAATGIDAMQWYRLVYGGHFPQLIDDEHPEWGARNVHELVSVVDSVLDMTRTTDPARRGTDPSERTASTVLGEATLEVTAQITPRGAPTASR